MTTDSKVIHSKAIVLKNKNRTLGFANLLDSGLHSDVVLVLTVRNGTTAVNTGDELESEEREIEIRAHKAILSMLAVARVHGHVRTQDVRGGGEQG